MLLLVQRGAFLIFSPTEIACILLDLGSPSLNKDIGHRLFRQKARGWTPPQNGCLHLPVVCGACGKQLLMDASNDEIKDRLWTPKKPFDPQETCDFDHRFFSYVGPFFVFCRATGILRKFSKTLENISQHASEAA